MNLQSLRKLAVSAVMTTALSTTMLIAVPAAYADDHAKCQHEIERREASSMTLSANTASAAIRLTSGGGTWMRNASVAGAGTTDGGTVTNIAGMTIATGTIARSSRLRL